MISFLEHLLFLVSLLEFYEVLLEVVLLVLSLDFQIVEPVFSPLLGLVLGDLHAVLVVDASHLVVRVDIKRPRGLQKLRVPMLVSERDELSLQAILFIVQ